MNYLKSLISCFLIVFFANYLIPGIDVIDQTKIPHIGGDLMFALGLGLLNSLIAPFLKLLIPKMVFLRVSMISFVLNYAAYGLLKVLPVGIFMTSIEGFLFAATAVSVGSIVLNFLEMRKRKEAPLQFEDPMESYQAHPPES